MQHDTSRETILSSLTLHRCLIVYSPPHPFWKPLPCRFYTLSSLGWEIRILFEQMQSPRNSTKRFPFQLGKRSPSKIGSRPLTTDLETVSGPSHKAVDQVCQSHIAHRGLKTEPTRSAQGTLNKTALTIKKRSSKVFGWLCSEILRRSAIGNRAVGKREPTTSVSLLTFATWPKHQE